MNNLELAVTAVVSMAVNRGGTWAVCPGEQPKRKRYAVKQGTVVRRSAWDSFSVADIAENSRRIEATREGLDIVLVSYL
jgi:hypothetical protein